ncbi:MAG: SPOR domain-containing protein, partial [Flavobacteriaceae bacterium]|nr:SPOR domain-containing protein [Flavobacteriaceae bacterium]
QDKKIQFIPLDKINFELKSFGLHTYERYPILKTVNKSNPNDIMDDTSNDNLMFTPEQKENKKKSTIFRYAATGIIAIALVGASYFFGDRYVTEQRVVEQEKAQKQIEINVQEATFDIGSLNSVNISVSTSPAKELVLDQIYFSIIAGSFRSVKNAENKLAILKAEGYPAALAELNPVGLYRVAYGRYNSKKEAINMLYFLKYTLEEEAWYLEER